jgi:hypothetical protein
VGYGGGCPVGSRSQWVEALRPPPQRVLVSDSDSQLRLESNEVEARHEQVARAAASLQGGGAVARAL